jgi:hypothetical protein
MLRNVEPPPVSIYQPVLVESVLQCKDAALATGRIGGAWHCEADELARVRRAIAQRTRTGNELAIIKESTIE